MRLVLAFQPVQIGPARSSHFRLAAFGGKPQSQTQKFRKILAHFRKMDLDPVKDFPIHVDFMRLGEGATIRVSVPLRLLKADVAPGVKRGGTVNLVTHAIDVECAAEGIPQFIEADVGALEISHSLHLSDLELPPGVKPLAREDVTLVTIVPPSGCAEELKAAAAAGAAAPAAGAAPAAATAGAKAPAGGGDKKK